jgi:hypothetical protein
MNQATTGKDPEPLSMAKILEGTGLLNSSKTLRTFFKVTFQTEALFDAQITWLKKMLPKWENLLIKKSGTTTIHNVGIRLDDSGKTEYDRAKLIACLWIDGVINGDAIKYPRMKKMLSGQIKKFLAEEIMKKFPPPFDYKHPNFAAGVHCSFSVQHREYNKHWKGSEIKILNDSRFYDKLNDFLAANGFEALSYSTPKKKSDAFKFSVEIKREIIWSDYKNFHNELRKFFLKNLLTNLAVYNEN